MSMKIRRVEDVENELQRIRDISYDDERAHAWEDDLRRAVLEAIASGDHVDEPSALCTAALKTSEIKFARWCA